MTSILLVDDETNILRALRRVLSREGWEIHCYDDPRKALEELAFQPVDLVLSDYRMPYMNGAEFLSEFRQIQPDAMRLILSGQADMTGLIEAINSAMIYRFISKPWDDAELLLTIQQALRVGQLERENRELAATVRNQSRAIQIQIDELRRLETLNPGITQVNWDEDGYIDLSGEFEDGTRKDNG